MLAGDMRSSFPPFGAVPNFRRVAVLAVELAILPLALDECLELRFVVEKVKKCHGDVDGDFCAWLPPIPDLRAVPGPIGLIPVDSWNDEFVESENWNDADCVNSENGSGSFDVENRA